MTTKEVNEMDENELIEIDFDEMSDSEVLVLLIIDEDRPILKTRLQKLSLLYHELYDTNRNTTDHHAYFFGGYSDDIDESATNLIDKGILEEGKNGYSLSQYGIKLRRFFLKEYDDVDEIEGVENIKKAVHSIPDRNLVGLTYHFYGESAKNSTIKQSVEKMNSTSKYDGIPLKNYSLADFEAKLRSGIEIRRNA